MSVGGGDSSQMSGGNLDDVDSVLDFDDYRNILDSKYVYYKKNCDNIKYHFRDSNSNVSEIIKLIIQKTLTSIEDIELNRKIPKNATDYTLLTCERIVLPFAGLYDDCQNDYLTNGLIEDMEPIPATQDAWIRHKIQIDQKNLELYDMIGKLPGPPNKKRSPDSKSVFSTKSKASSKVNIKLEQTEEQLKLQKIKKEKNVIGTTYDYDGELMPVQRMKIQKLPPSSYNMNYDFKDHVKTPENANKKKLQRKQNVPKLKKGKEQPLPPLSKPAIEQQPALFDTIQLSAGVALTFDGRRRTGPRPQTLDSQTLTMATLYPNQTATFSKGKKIRLHKREYEEIINNQDKLGSHKVSDQKLPDISHDDGPVDPFLMGKTLDAVQFATRLKHNTIEKSKSSGGIQIKSIKNFENFTHQISEEDELLHQMIQKQEQEKKLQELKRIEERRNQQTPVDKFNYDLTYNKEWGKQHYETGQTLMNYPFGNHKPSEKDQYQSLGKTQKPRSRLGVKGDIEQLQVRQATADGFRRPGTTAEGQRSSQGIRIKVTNGKQFQQQDQVDQ